MKVRMWKQKNGHQVRDSKGLIKVLYTVRDPFLHGNRGISGIGPYEENSGFRNERPVQSTWWTDVTSVVSLLRSLGRSLSERCSCWRCIQLTKSVDEDPRLKFFQREWFEGKDCLDVGCNEGFVTISIGIITFPSLSPFTGDCFSHVRTLALRT